MSEFFKAELKDRFLAYAQERDDYFEVQLLYDEFLRPNYSLDFVQKLIREIIDHDAELLDIMSGNGAKIFMLSSTPRTLEFLQEGGFKDLYLQEEEKWDTFLEQLSNPKRLSAKEKANLGHTQKKAYKRERLLLFSLIAAVGISFIFTLFGVIRPLFMETEEVRLQRLEKRVEQLEKEQTELQRNLDSVRLNTASSKLQK